MASFSWRSYSSRPRSAARGGAKAACWVGRRAGENRICTECSIQQLKLTPAARSNPTFLYTCTEQQACTLHTSPKHLARPDRCSAAPGPSARSARAGGSGRAAWNQTPWLGPCPQHPRLQGARSCGQTMRQGRGARGVSIHWKWGGGQRGVRHGKHRLQPLLSIPMVSPRLHQLHRGAAAAANQGTITKKLTQTAARAVRAPLTRCQPWRAGAGAGAACNPHTAVKKEQHPTQEWPML